MGTTKSNNLIVPDSPLAPVESPRQEPCHSERVLQSDQHTPCTFEVPRQDVLEAHANGPEMISDKDALLEPCEREVVKLLAEAIAMCKVKQDTLNQRQGVPIERTITTSPVTTNRGPCPSQYSGPFIPNPRHYSRIHPTDTDFGGGNLFNPAAVPSGSEEVWLDDAFRTGLRILHNCARPGSDSTSRSLWEGVQGARKIYEIVKGTPAQVPPSASAIPFDLPPF